MAAIVWADVTGMFPSDGVLAAIPVAAQTNILAHVNGELSANFFGGESAPKTKLARIYLAAHMAVTGGAGSAITVGPLVSEKLGPLEQTFSDKYPPNMNFSGPVGIHGSTTYGRLFDELVRTSPYRVGLTS